MIPVTVVIPGPPFGKGRPRFNRATGFVYTPTETRNREAFVRERATTAMGGRDRLDGPVHMEVLITIEPPASWSGRQRKLALAGARRPVGKPDLDNCIKSLADAFEGVVFRNDTQVVAVSAAKRYGEREETIVVVRPVPETTVFDRPPPAEQPDPLALAAA